MPIKLQGSHGYPLQLLETPQPEGLPSETEVNPLTSSHSSAKLKQRHMEPDIIQETEAGFNRDFQGNRGQLDSTNIGLY